MKQQLNVLQGYMVQAQSTLGEASEAATFEEVLSMLPAVVRDMRDVVECASSICKSASAGDAA